MLRTMTAITTAGYILLIDSKALQTGQAKLIILLISIRMIYTLGIILPLPTPRSVRQTTQALSTILSNTRASKCSPKTSLHDH